MASFGLAQEPNTESGEGTFTIGSEGTCTGEGTFQGAGIFEGTGEFLAEEGTFEGEGDFSGTGTFRGTRNLRDGWCDRPCDEICLVVFEQTTDLYTRQT